MRKTIYEAPQMEVIESIPEECILAASDQGGGLENYGNGQWVW